MGTREYCNKLFFTKIYVRKTSTGKKAVGVSGQ